MKTILIAVDVLICGSTFPKTRITVFKNLCGVTSAKNHLSAIDAMKSCMIEISGKASNGV